MKKSIEQIQQALLDRNFDPHGVDGKMGKNTVQATKDFQHSVGLYVDGVAGPLTLEALFAEEEPKVQVNPVGKSSIPKAWMPKADIDRVIIHWTAGSHQASKTDREHYHILWEFDGTAIRGIPTIDKNDADGAKSGYAAHTLNCNTGSIGVSMCCMAGAIESPFKVGSAPMTKEQWDAMISGVADLCKQYGIPVTDRTVLTHAEVQGTLGIKQRGKWDITRLAFNPSVVGAKACGDLLRRSVAALL